MRFNNLQTSRYFKWGVPDEELCYNCWVFSAGFFLSIVLEKLNNSPKSLPTNREGLAIFDIWNL